jgi:hypothetical protein
MAGRPPEPDDEHEPTPDDDDIDVRFADITANLGDLTVPPEDGAVDASADAAPDREPSETGFGPRDYTLGRELELEPEPEEQLGFVPPAPPPLTGGEPLVALAWTGIAAPVGLVLIYLVLWRGMPGVVLTLAGVAFVLSVGILIWRMPGRRDADDHDDGAVV